MLKYDKLSLDIIKSSDILKPEDFKELANLKDELEDVFIHAQIFRTRTEMEVSVLNDLKFPTADAKYWQAIREQNVMFQELVMLSFEYRKNLIEIKKLERDLKNEKDDLEKQILGIEIEKKKFISLNQARVAKARIREIKEWHQIKKNLLPNMKYGFKDVNEHQLISYTKRFINQYMTSKGSGSPAERANLTGQLQTALKTCRDKNILDKVLPLNSRIRKQLLGEK